MRKEYLKYKLNKLAGDVVDIKPYIKKRHEIENLVNESKGMLSKLEKQNALLGHVSAVKYILDRKDKDAENLVKVLKQYYGYVENPRSLPNKLYFNYNKQRGALHIHNVHSGLGFIDEGYKLPLEKKLPMGVGSTFISDGRDYNFYKESLVGKKLKELNAMKYPDFIAVDFKDLLIPLGIVGALTTAAGLYQRHRLHKLRKLRKERKK